MNTDVQRKRRRILFVVTGVTYGLLLTMSVLIQSVPLNSLKFNVLLLLLALATMAMAVFLNLLTYASIVFGRGVVRAFFLGTLIGGCVVGTCGVYLLSLVAGSLLAIAQGGEGVDTIDAAEAFASVWQISVAMRFDVHLWIGLASGAIAALLVWAARGPMPQHGVRQFRRRRAWRLFIVVLCLLTATFAARWIPHGDLGLLVCGYLTLPAMGIAGLACGRKRVKATALGLLPLWLALPYTGTTVFTFHAQLLDSATPSIESLVVALQFGLLVIGFSCVCSYWLCVALRRHRVSYRRRFPTPATVCRANLFPTPCCCDGDCGP